MANEFVLTDDDGLNSAVLVGLMGPSSSGKTYSAYELAVGFQRATGGDIAVLDTEAMRAKHYIRKFRGRTTAGGRIRHMEFTAPFAASRYIQAIEACVDAGCRTVIVDSASHAHDGPGGMLDQHAQEVERLSRGNPERAEAVGALAWTKPKQESRRMLTHISTTLKINAIFCFRAQQKLNWKVKNAKGQPSERGWIPIADPALIYEMTVNFLLNPGSDGTPDWNPAGTDAGRILKRPEQFRDFLVPGRRIDSDMGERMGLWAAGKDVSPPHPPATAAQSKPASQPPPAAQDEEATRRSRSGVLYWTKKIQGAEDPAALEAVGVELAGDPGLIEVDKHNLRGFYGKRKAELTGNWSAK